MNTWQDELRKGNFRARELHRKNYGQEQNIILKWYAESGMREMGKVLEIGCGEFPLFNDSTKIDIAKVRDDIIQIDCNYPFANKFDGTFNMIITQYVVCHLWNIDNFFTECHKLLEDDGILIISLPNENYWRKKLNTLVFNQDEELLWHIDNKTYWRLNPKVLEKLVGRYEFKVEDIKPIGRSKSLDISAAMIAKLRRMLK